MRHPVYRNAWVGRGDDGALPESPTPVFAPDYECARIPGWFCQSGSNRGNPGEIQVYTPPPAVYRQNVAGVIEIAAPTMTKISRCVLGLWAPESVGRGIILENFDHHPAKARISVSETYNVIKHQI